MKGKLFKKALAVATSVLMLSGGVPIKPVADLFGSTSITAYAQGSNVDLSTLTGSYTAQDGEILSGTTSQTITIADDASITLNGVTITGGIVCAGTAEITLVGTNSVTGFSRYDPNIGAYRYTAGIQIGGSGTTLTINGDGSLTANGGQYAAGIGLNGAWNVTEDVIGGNIVINGGNITANGGVGAAGIGAGFTKDPNNSSERKAIVGNITIKGGTVTAVGVTAVGGNGADGIGAGDNIYNATYQIGTVTIYDDIDKVDASAITESVTYMHIDGNTETDVTANASTYFTITEDGNRRVIAPKDDTDYTITIANGIEHGTITGAATAKYMETVTINATPDFGYRLVRLVVKDADNNDVALTNNTFLMPKSNVTVSAVFEQGVHGTTEFTWRYSTGPNPTDEVRETIYDGVTTVNIQETGQNVYTGTSYTIQKYEGYTNYKFRLDNNEDGQAIPFTGTGEFVQNQNPTAFYVTDNNELGFYDITMTDTGNGKWSLSIQKTAGQMDVVPDQTYTGSEITPEPIVLAGSLNLTKGTDYVYSYTNNTDAGTATVRATFQGDYASLGYVEKEFTILPSTVMVSVTGNGTVTYNDKSAANGETIGVTAEKGTDVTLTFAPESGYAVRSVEYGYTNSNEMTTNGAKLPINGTTATLTVPNDLKDGTYVNLTVTFVSALAGGADEASAVALTDNTVTDLAGGWYKVDSDITFDHTLNLLGDTHLIIDDGKTMTVNTASNRGIDSDYTLTVSGAGALNVTTTSSGVAIRVGNYVQTGATVTASGYIGIRCTDDFIAFNFDNDFTFSGGQLTATGSGGNGIWADNDITLSCTNATDFIQASSYSSGYGAVKIADGQTLTDGTEASNGMNGYSGTLTNEQRTAIGGKALKLVATMDIIPDQTYTGSAITPEPTVIAGSLSLTKGTDYTYSYTNNTNVGTAKVTVTFKGDYASLGSVEKEFNIVRATPTVTAPTANTLTYNGNEQELVTAGSTDFGKVHYSLDGTNYSEEVPKGTSAGDYTIYYKVEGSDNWNAVEPQTVGVKIAESYTVTWKNGDETLETDKFVRVGTAPEYNGETPTKAATAQYTYTFSGWSPTVSAVTSDVTYTATFTAHSTYVPPTYYTITYKVDGEVYQTASSTSGSKITLIDEPTKEGYTFSGWQTSYTTMPAQNIEITGTFAINQYAVTYMVDGVQYGESLTVDHGTKLTAPNAPAKNGAIFLGWTADGVNTYDFETPVTAETTLTAMWLDASGFITFSEGYAVTDNTYNGTDRDYVGFRFDVNMDNSNYTVVQHGILYGMNVAAFGNGQADANLRFTDEEATALMDKVREFAAQNTDTETTDWIEVYIGDRRDGVVYARGFIIVTDGTNNYLIYSDVQEGSYNSFSE